jgi:hypothetical protein
MFLGYSNLLVRLDDGSIGLIAIDRYLNAGITGNPKYPRAIRAGEEKDALLGAIGNELGVPGTPPLQFEIGGQVVSRRTIQKTFAGKGSPGEIRTTLWLASRYKRTSSVTLRSYSDRFVGLDCNGFAGNYWGIDPNTPIDSYDTSRRRDPAAISVGDALPFYHKGATSPFHIAVVDEVAVKGDRMTLTVVQSAGPELGVHQEILGERVLQRNAAGHLFFLDGGGDWQVFVAEGPAKGTPNA